SPKCNNRNIMKVKMHYNYLDFPPLITMSIWGCPHYRQDDATLLRFRKVINKAASAAGIIYPIDEVVDMNILFIDLTTTDNANSLMALYRAVDGKALKGKSLLTDDGLISKLTIMKFYPS